MGEEVICVRPDQIVLIYLDNDPYNIRGANQPHHLFFFFSLSLLFFTYYFHFLLGFCFVGLFIFSGSLFCVHTQTNGRGG